MISNPSSSKRSIDLEAATAIGNIVKSGLKKGRVFKSNKKKPSRGDHKVADNGKRDTKQKSGPTREYKSAPKVSDARAMGIDATHTRNMDTGRLNKITPAQKEGVSKYYSSRQFPKSTTPAADLRGFE